MSTKGMYRNSDPHTSKAGAQDVSGRKITQSMRLLRTYVGKVSGQTDDEAAAQAELTHTCYWKRCSELRQEGYIHTLKIMGSTVTRKGKAGSERIVCWLSDEGLKKLKEEGLA